MPTELADPTLETVVAGVPPPPAPAEMVTVISLPAAVAWLSVTLFPPTRTNRPGPTDVSPEVFPPVETPTENTP